MDETLTLPKDLITQALKEALDKARVPQRQHLMVIQALQRRMEEHKRDMTSYQDALTRHEAELKNHEERDNEHKRQIADWDNTSQHLLSIEHLKGDDGITPVKGVDYFDGESGADADEDAIVNRIIEMLPNFIPEPVPGKDAQFDQDAIIKTLITTIQKEKLLDISHIKGAQKFIKDNISYKTEELMHGGGLVLLNPVSGLLNDTNTTFVFATKPRFVVVNGATYRNGHGVTITGQTAVLDNPPGVNADVYAFP